MIHNNLIKRTKEYIFIFLTATIFLLASFSKSFSDDSIFVVDDIVVSGNYDTNFSRNKYINKALTKSFESLISKILLSSDKKKIKKVKLKNIENLISSFQILEEKYKGNKYEAKFKVFYNDKKVKKFLVSKNISYTEAKKISAIYYPVLFTDGEIKNFQQNYFYNEWLNIEIDNELINFILPLENLDDIKIIERMKNNIEKLEIKELVNKYDIENYVFTLASYNNQKLNIYIKTEFESNQISKNFSYVIKDIENKKKLNFIIKDLKIKINDLWKEKNLVNLLMPLSIKINFKYGNFINLDNLKDVLNKISIIDNYTLDEIDTDSSSFKIYYYGNPKRLKNELFKYEYNLNNNNGYWEVNLYD